MHGMAEDLIAEIEAALAEAPDLSVIVLHGSALTGHLRPDSDVDLALAGDEPLDADRLVELDALLGRRLGRGVDLRDLRRARGLFLYRLLRTGRVLRNRDPRLLAHLACEAMDWATDVLPAGREGQRRYLAAVGSGHDET